MAANPNQQDNDNTTTGGSGNNNNNTANKPNLSSSGPNTENEEKIGNDGISGNAIVAIVKGFGGTDFKAIAKETGKTIEASLTDSAKLFDSLAQGQKEELLTKQGVKCGLDEIVAAGLALELMKKYPKQQSNANDPSKNELSAVAVFTSVKNEMNDDTYKHFEKACESRDVSGAQWYLASCSMFKKNPSLLTPSMVDGIMTEVRLNKSRKNDKVIVDQIFDIKTKGARKQHKNAKKQSQNQEATKIIAENMESDQKVNESKFEEVEKQNQVLTKRIDRNEFRASFKYGLGTVSGIIAFIVGCLLGAYLHPFDAVIFIETPFVVIMGLLFVAIAKTPACQTDSVWACQQVVNGVIFACMGFVGALVTLGKMSGVFAVLSVIGYIISCLTGLALIGYIFHLIKMWNIFVDVCIMCVNLTVSIMDTIKNFRNGTNDKVEDSEESKEREENYDDTHNPGSKENNENNEMDDNKDNYNTNRNGNGNENDDKSSDKSSNGSSDAHSNESSKGFGNGVNNVKFVSQSVVLSDAIVAQSSHSLIVHSDHNDSSTETLSNENDFVKVRSELTGMN